VRTVNMFEAKSNLSRLVEAIASGAEAEIVIARNGRPVARLVPVATTPAGQRLGVARGVFVVPDTIDAANEEIDRLFHGARA
jgi:prevent-host-death family protein